MAEVKGTDGAVFYVSARSTTGDTKEEIAGIDSWELTPAADKDETTDYTDGKDKTFVQTTVGWTGRIAGSYQTTGKMQDIIDMFSSTDATGPTALELEMWASTAARDALIGDFLVDSIANTGSVGTKRAFDASVTATAGVRHSTYST